MKRKIISIVVLIGSLFEAQASEPEPGGNFNPPEPPGRGQNLYKGDHGAMNKGSIITMHGCIGKIGKLLPKSLLVMEEYDLQRALRAVSWDCKEVLSKYEMRSANYKPHVAMVSGSMMNDDTLPITFSS